MTTKLITAALIAATMFSCKEATKNETVTDEPKIEAAQEVVTSVMTKEAQDALTPDGVWQEFLEGNKRFQSGTTTVRNHSEQTRKAVPGQYPKAVVLSCLDSRVPVEDVFDQGLGDIFVARVAGNFVNEDMLGSLEFACKVAGSKLVLVMGHQHCGAVKGAIDDVKLGNITAMLTKIKPAVAMSQDFEGEKSSSNEEFVRHVCENNVINTLKQIRERSPILKEMEDKGEIKIMGVFYRLTDGTLQVL
jgi:carbonic anhydrase